MLGEWVAINNMATLAESRREPYVGEKKKQLRDGFGVYIYENKFFKYEGEWKNGKKHGHGKLTMADGSYYEGEFSEGEIDGHGYRWYAVSGNSYSGQFWMGELHGQGVMKYKDGSVYEGEWFRNTRQGYGIYRCTDNSVYQGYLHNHQRHGEGVQIYSNGDRYDGDWIKDKRQGQGEYRERDGTVYDGQWQNDIYNGQGTMNHSSGMYYEGLWVNGRPAILATKLGFKNPDPIEIMQGLPFSVEVQCLDEDGNLVEDMGRQIQLTAGFKYTPPTKEETEDGKENPSPGLFDMIEDIAEKPIPTPFGYSIIPYPMTDQFPYEENDEVLLGLGSRANTTMSEAIAEDLAPTQKESDKAKEEEPKEVDTTEPAAAENVEGTEITTTDETQTSSDPQDQAQGGETQTPGVQEVPLPPPVSNLRCDHGTVTFSNLVLAAAPPMYRPFTQIDEVEKKPKSRSSKKNDGQQSPYPDDESGPTSRSKSQERTNADDQSRPATRSKSREKTNVGDDRFARGAPSRGKSGRSETKSVTGKSGRKSVSSAKSKKRQAEIVQQEEEPPLFEESDLEDEETSAALSVRFAIPGEYVIVAQDVTSPPFIGFSLEPAFLILKVNVPKKPKKPKKDTRPKWDTSKHIAASMARGYSDLAADEEANLLATAIPPPQ